LANQRFGGSPLSGSVEAWSIDEFVADRGIVPAFVNIDAESAEMAILNGMKNTLATCRPLVAMEVGDMDVPGAASQPRTGSRSSE